MTQYKKTRVCESVSERKRLRSRHHVLYEFERREVMREKILGIPPWRLGEELRDMQSCEMAVAQESSDVRREEERRELQMEWGNSTYPPKELLLQQTGLVGSSIMGAW